MLRLCLAASLILLRTSSSDTCEEDADSGSCSAQDAGPGGSSADGVCFAVIAKESHWKELEVRVSQILRHQHYNFASTYIVLDTDGKLPSERLKDGAEKLVTKGLLDKWLVVDYSPEFIRRMNKTADWDPFEHAPPPGFRDRHKTVSYTEFNEDHEEQERPAHYFAIDQCAHGYLVVMQIEVIWMSYRSYSWVSAGLQLLQDNEGLVLVMPAYPGIEYRRVRQKPTTREIIKKHKTLHHPSIEAEDTTCQYPISLPGWVSLLDLRRYHKVGRRQKYREYRCGGQLVKGKKCKDYQFLRGCGGMRLWENSLECVICNRGSLRQAQLTDSDIGWVQKAPITCFRSDVADMIDGINLVENGTVFPVSGMDFTLKLEEDEDSDI